MKIDHKVESFLSLVERVRSCHKCPRMEGSARVLGLGCGSLNSEIMFVGEAPGRLGADESMLPFHGDKSGHNFESLISQVGISRYDVFVTNSVLCNPKDADGNNATPTVEEIRNCSGFLGEQVDLINPKIVVTLGSTALKASGYVSPHDFELKKVVRTSLDWNSRKLIAAYHPGQRAMVHRSFANQLSDYQFIAEEWRRIGRGRRKKYTSGPRSGDAKLAEAVSEILENCSSSISYFSLHKLLYLSEVVSLELSGERICNSYVVRQKDGPYYVDLHISRLTSLIPSLRVVRGRDGIRLGLPMQIDIESRAVRQFLAPHERVAISKAVGRYGKLTDFDLKRVCYISRPMREILRSERRLHLNFFNAPVLPYRDSDS